MFLLHQLECGCVSVSVGDLNGCTLLDTITINEPNPISTYIHIRLWWI